MPVVLRVAVESRSKQNHLRRSPCSNSHDCAFISACLCQAPLFLRVLCHCLSFSLVCTPAIVSFALLSRPRPVVCCPPLLSPSRCPSCLCAVLACAPWPRHPQPPQFAARRARWLRCRRLRRLCPAASPSPPRRHRLSACPSPPVALCTPPPLLSAAVTTMPPMGVVSTGRIFSRAKMSNGES